MEIGSVGNSADYYRRRGRGYPFGTFDGVPAHTWSQSCRGRPSAAITEGRYTRNARFTGLPMAPAGNSSENCRHGIPEVQQASTPDFCKLLKIQGKPHRVFTGDPHVRRQISICSESALFLTTYVPSRSGLPIETC